jgi:sulfhydrogenase subunit beta (sulfur reductase)
MIATSSRVFEADRLESLLEAIIAQGYETIGPVVREGAIVYDRFTSVAELPLGWTDEQAPGRYTLKPSDMPAFFGFAAGPQGLKRFFFRPDRLLWSAHRNNGDASFDVENSTAEPPRLAFFGVRACDLAALRIHDRVFLGGRFVEPDYAAHRRDVLIVAVNCAMPASNCFCASMGTGPEAREGFDIALTEVIDMDRHLFVAAAGSSRGEALLEEIGALTAGDADLEKGREVIETAYERIGKYLMTDGVRELVAAGANHPVWEETAARCLTCGNCTMVCPTCFCSTVVDQTSLDGDTAERRQRWDSCFNIDFSYIHGGAVRSSPASRYRQWLTHKFSTWHDQFGTSGCVGCGRCITWCPVGIDVTEIIDALDWKRTPRETVEIT